MIDIHSHILPGVDDGSASMKESLQLLSLIVLAALLAGAVIAGVATKIFITPVYSATSTMLVLTKETVKPGLTGMWQVSGRSDITDFEEVVKLDMEYVKNWNIGMDIKILLKTVGVVLKGSGSK